MPTLTNPDISGLFYPPPPPPATKGVLTDCGTRGGFCVGGAVGPNIKRKEERV